MQPVKNKILTLKNLHLIISSIIVIPTAFVYGINPSFSLPQLFDFEVTTTDLNNVFRTIMGLYLFAGFIWILGILKPKFWVSATITNIVFMGGLALGRFLSLLLDGIPSTAFVLGLFGEFILAVFGIIQLKKYSK